MRRGLLVLACCFSIPAWAADSLTTAIAADWLKRVADAPRRLSYEGVFVFQQGDAMQTVRIANRPDGSGKDSRLTTIDGVPREVRCTGSESVSISGQGGQAKFERRLNSRHFPDLLPTNAERLLAWYNLKVGATARVAGLECRQLELIPKDHFRWGYVLCADKDTNLPLKAVMVNEHGQPLMQYAFTEVRFGDSGTLPSAKPSTGAAEVPFLAAGDALNIKQLPPGFAREVAIRRKLPQHGEIEHWVFSDGLTHISMFIEPMAKPFMPVKGESKQGMVNMLVRQVGDYQVTVLGEAPWSAVEAIAMGLEPKPR